MAFLRRFKIAGFENLVRDFSRRHFTILVGRDPSANGAFRLQEFKNLRLSSHTMFRSFVASGQVTPKPKLEAKGQDWRKPKVETLGGIRLNEAIDEPEVRLVTDEGHKVVSIQKALYMARQLNVDLVEVQGKAKVEGIFKPPVCKLMDFYKEKYKQDLKEKERSKSKATNALRNGENKEVRFKAKTELKDLKIKADAVKRLMERGYRVKCTAVPTGKDAEDPGNLLLNLLTLIEDISVVESGPHLDTKNAYVIVKHIKFVSKKGKKVSTAMEIVSSVLSARSNATIDDDNNASKDEDAPKTEEQLEIVDSDSDAVNDQILGAVSSTDFNNKRSNSEGNSNKSSERSTTGFQHSEPTAYATEHSRYSKVSNSTLRQNPLEIHPQPESKATETNRYSKGNSQNKTANREPFFTKNTANRNQGRTSAQTSRPNPSPRMGASNNPTESNVTQTKFGVFKSTKPTSVDERQANSSKSSYGIFSTNTDKFSNANSNSSSPRFGAFSPLKNAARGEGLDSKR